MEYAIAAYRVTFQRTPNEGERLADIPRAVNGWPMERDFARWPTPDQEEWVGAAVVGYLEGGLADEKDGDSGAMDKAWATILEFLSHVGIDLEDKQALGDATASDLLLAHYRTVKGRYDCEAVVMDYLTFPPVAALISEARRRQRVQQQARRAQKQVSQKRRRKPKADSLTNDFSKADG